MSCFLHLFGLFFVCFLALQPKPITGKTFPLLVELCLYTKWRNQKCEDAGWQERNGRWNHAEGRSGHRSGGDFHPAENHVLSVPHLWVDVIQPCERTRIPLNFHLLKLSERWLTQWFVRCFFQSHVFNSTMKMMQRSFISTFSSLQQVQHILIVMSLSLWF